MRKIEEIIDEDDEDDGDFDELEPLPIGWDGTLRPDDFLQALELVFGDLPAGPPAAPRVPPPCRVVLNASQRAMLCQMDTISLDLQKMLAVDSPGELEFQLNPRHVIVATLAIKEAVERFRDEKSAWPYLEIVDRINEGMAAALEQAEAQEAGDHYARSQRGSARVAFQLKVTLERSKPPIWRRILVADCTLDVLHQVVQTAMGWTDSHMHQFEYGKDCFSDPRFELDGDYYDETQVLLSDVVANGCKKLRYWYDFGDDWWHTITIEKTLKPKPIDKFPTCVKGVGACPPEDCGGICGYYELLEAIRDPKHERHDDLVDWLGGEFDPGRFDLDEINAALVRGPSDLIDP